MSEAFGWTVDMVEQQVVNLIQSGEIQGRVDSQNKVRFVLLRSRTRLSSLGTCLIDPVREEDGQSSRFVFSDYPSRK